MGISLSWRDLPDMLIEQHRLEERVVTRAEGAAREIRFLWRDPYPLLPAWYGMELHVYPWGNRSRRSKLPQTAWIGVEDLEAGTLAELAPEEVDIPAAFGYAGGVWFHIFQGIRGVLVRDEHGKPRVYMLTEPASHYYQTMTGHKRMPVLLGKKI
jgi:hypothetical protein